MADTTATKVLINDGVFYAFVYAINSDGTGQADAQLVDKSALTALRSGKEPVALDLVEARWALDNMIAVAEWDRATDQTIIPMAGNNHYCAEEDGEVADPKANAGETSTGDVLLTTTGHASGDTAWLYMKFRLRV